AGVVARARRPCHYFGCNASRAAKYPGEASARTCVDWKLRVYCTKVVLLLETTLGRTTSTTTRRFRYIPRLTSQGRQGGARHSVRAAGSNLFAERRARSDAPYLTYVEISLSQYRAKAVPRVGAQVPATVWAPNYPC